MSYQFAIEPRRRAAGRLISRVRRALAQAVSEERAEKGTTQQSLAQKLGVHRSVINRILTGEGNLTLRSLAEIAWALDRTVTISIEKQGVNSNESVNTYLTADFCAIAEAVNATTNSSGDLKYTCAVSANVAF